MNKLNKKTRKQYRKKTQKRHKKDTKKTQKGGENELTFINNPFEKISTIINNNYIYKIIIDNYTYFFYIIPPIDYGIIEHKYIIKLNNDTIFKVDEIIQIYNDKQTTYSKRLKKLKEMNTYELEYQKLELNDNLQTKINDAKQKIVEYNILLREKCTNLSFKFDYLYNLNGSISSYSINNYLTLCIYVNDDYCVSSINMQILNDDTVIIDSITDEKFQNKKYNKLLRSVCIVLCYFFNVKTIISSAINPISAWLLLSQFNAYISDNNTEYYNYIKDNNINTKNPDELRRIIFEYMNDDNRSLILFIKLNNKDYAETKFKEILNEIICE